MHETPETILRVEDLSYQYGKLVVWEHLGFSLEAGSLTFLEGQNGSGKSTLLRCLAGLSYPKTGNIILLGEKFSGRNREQRAQLSFIADTPSFYDDMTADEHICFILQANHKSNEYTEAALLLEEFGIARFADQYPSSFSRGMREKLALVIAFTIKPRLYLFDEPYGPLDPQASKVLSEKIKERLSEGASVMLSCHHAIPDLVPDRVLVLDEGSLRET